MIRLSLGLPLLAVSLAAQTPRTDYQRDVHPVLAARCFACHGGDKRSGGLSLRDYASVLEGGRSGAALVPGDSKESQLMRRVTGETQPAMPPGGKLTDREIATLRSWIDEGARATPASAAAKRRFQPQLKLEAPALPAVVWPAWTSPVDRLMAAYLRSHGVAEPKLVSDAVYARRTYLDLWGLLPSPEQMSEFTRDSQADKRAGLVRQLLAHRSNYAGHWVSFWNDLLHNEELMYHGGERRTITPWLLKSLEENLPYNRFVEKLLNPTEPDDPHGFLIGVNWRGDVSASQTPAMQAAQNTAQVLLGINLKCNSCHDSFISRWKLKDAYGLAAYFSPAGNLEMVRCDAATGKFTGPQFLYPELEKPAGESLAERHAAAAAIFTDPANGRTPRTYVNRIWRQLFGRGIVEPLDDMDAEPFSPELLDWIAADFVAHSYDTQYLLTTLVTSRAYQLASVPRPETLSKDFTFRGPYVRRLTAEQFLDSLSAITGEWRTYLPAKAKQAVYVRDFRLGPSAVATAMGKPNREQVVTERNDEATTLQALELVNGRDLFKLVSNGARRMRGEIAPAPVPLWDSGSVTSGTVKNPPRAEIDVARAEQLWLVTVDKGSYDPELTKPLWKDAVFVTAAGEVPVTVALPGVNSTQVLDLKGKGYLKLKLTATLDAASLRSDISPSVRFFVFDRQPDPERLVPVAPETPVASPDFPLPTDRLVARIYRHAYGREATARETQIARKAAADSAGLADLLWALSISPEFQLIR